MSPRSTIPLLTGNMMPIIGLGTWQLKNTADTIEEALTLGYAMIDTSSDYGTQPDIGAALKRSLVDREEVYIVTKVEETDDAFERAQRNLAELQTSYADLILIHRPPKTGAGEDLWRGLIKAKQEGLTRDIGVSNYSTEQIQALIDETAEIPVVNQIEWSPFGHSERMLEYAKSRSIVIQAYSPLTRTTRLGSDRLQAIADSYGKTPAQILIRWNIELGTVPLPKANHVAHLRENIDVFDFELSEEDVQILKSLNERYSALGSLPYD